MRWWSKEWLCETEEKAWCRGVSSRDLPDDCNYASLRDSALAVTYWHVTCYFQSHNITK